MKNTLLCFLMFIVGAAAVAQEVSEVERPKIGVVLSGGGAKGMAHIGALKVLEEAGIRIDYIGGTSMGAFVGALYAAGYTATQLDSIFRNTDFDQLIRDNLPRSAKTFYEKEDSDRYALTLPFEHFRVSVPPAYSGGQNIYNELVRVLYHVKDIHDFNKLPIPFLCIATNVETGEQVLMDKGYLPEAVLASGTLPSLFEPVTLEGKILIDGGVVNNYPLDEVKKLGADIIIGVDVQHGLSDREGLLSATEILLQINNFRTAAAMAGKSKRTDIYIKPSLDRYSVIDFNKYDEIMRLGEIAARNKWEELKQLSASGDMKRAAIKQVVPKDSLMVNRLIIDGDLDNYTRGYIKGKLRFNLGEKTTFKKLDQGIGNLSATGNFKTIHHKLTSNGTGEDLTLVLEENPNKNYLRFGLHYDDLYKSAAIANLTKKRFLMKDDVASFDFILGDKIRYNLQYYVDRGTYWSFGLNSRYNTFDNEINFDLIRDNFDVPSGININSLNIDVNDFTNQLYLQTVWREEFALTIGAEHKWLRISTQTLGEFLDENGLPILRTDEGRTLFEKSNYYSTFGQLVLDTYDDRYFPTRGLYFNGDFHLYLLSSDFNDNFKEFSVAKARMGAAIPLFKNLSLNLETEGGFKLGTSNVTSFDFVLGGYGTDLINNFVPFLGYDFLSLPGNSYVKAFGRLDLEFVRKNHLLFSANFANVEDDIFRTGEWFTSPDYSGYGLGYGWESFLGPVQVMYSWSPEAKNTQLFFSVGYWF